ncbi:hypothetical protein ES319_A11G358900v1 [Gossypium barbadense]|uniref:Uncharacterized protein n=1 Tax=Gossypium barbadense TaxID=3634 RepID=A0A5J5TW24_GOSBA|nr:hypothetical protein ES319_A11G358900v1 [Gossypium barbadense]
MPESCNIRASSASPSNAAGGPKFSGNSASPSRYSTICLMLGRNAGTSLEQMRPNLSTIIISLSLFWPCSLVSTTSTILPCLYFSHTQSTNTISSGNALCSTGLRPQATSSKSAPNAYTSELVVAFPVLKSSGARYPNVPTTLVVPGFESCSYNFARPKSPNLPFNS